EAARSSSTPTRDTAPSNGHATRHPDQESLDVFRPTLPIPIQLLGCLDAFRDRLDLQLLRELEHALGKATVRRSAGTASELPHVDLHEIRLELVNEAARVVPRFVAAADV